VASRTRRLSAVDFPEADLSVIDPDDLREFRLFTRMSDAPHEASSGRHRQLIHEPTQSPQKTDAGAYSYLFNVGSRFRY
jgi:hypothetical protein